MKNRRAPEGGREEEGRREAKRGEGRRLIASNPTYSRRKNPGAGASERRFKEFRLHRETADSADLETHE